MAALAGTPWIVISQQDDENPANGLILLNTATGTRLPVVMPAARGACTGGRGGGIGIRAEKHGFRLQRIVHGQTDLVETWRLTPSGHSIKAQRQACVPAPAELFLNDIAPLADSGFVATHMFDRSLPKTQLQTMFLAGQPTGVLMRWSARSGWAPIAGSQGTFLNGIDVSPDGRWIAFAETYGHAINRIRPDGSGRSRIVLAMQPDNVTALGDGRFVVVGGTGAPMASTHNCALLGQAGCAFAAAALLIDFNQQRQSLLVQSAGQETPGFSVGLVADRALWLGTSFGDRVTKVSLPKGWDKTGAAVAKLR
ncbi:MAG TPA: hypothetical protein VN222_10675 [Novosphingobium sp.]|nr:hypothetical protein [Novosphingobium sp.]